MQPKPKPLHPNVRLALRCSESTSDVEALTDWKQRIRRICKPCWELKYCPYGPLVEDFPLPPLTQPEIDQWNSDLRHQLESGKNLDGSPLDGEELRRIKDKLLSRESSTYPDELPKVIADASCRVFGHMCPVFFVAEPLTETVATRRISRSIPRDVMLKVVRRDGQICQTCHTPVPDNEVEFDHLIPFARGGSSTAENLRLVHRKCNREKSDSLDEILAPDPLVHLVAWRKKSRRGK
jgi:hypothetical protein